MAKLRDPRIDSLNKELAKRDDDNKNFDKFSVLIDPYSNGQLVYNFTVSASNVQSDSKIIRGNKDMLWDAVWNSEVKIYSKYWLVEIEIPLSNLRYSVENSSWNFNFERTIRRYRETYTWNYIDDMRMYLYKQVLLTVLITWSLASDCLLCHIFLLTLKIFSLNIAIHITLEWI